MSLNELLCPSPEDILVYKTKEVMLYSFFCTFPGFRILYAGVSEHSVCSTFIGGVLTPPMNMEMTECSERSAH